MHNTAIRHYGLDLSYTALEVPDSDLADLPGLLNHKNFVGSNVTIPHKLVVRDFIDDFDEIVNSVGAVNTIYRIGSKLLGTNTDVHGFSLPLTKYVNQIQGQDAIVFGTGGASRSIVYSLGELGVGSVYMISRNPDQINTDDYQTQSDLLVTSYDAWPHYIDDVALLVNASPMGMVPNDHISPVPDIYANLLENKICYDIVCKPVQTKFLSLAESAGGIIIQGLDMLIHQGSESFKVWTGNPFPIELIRSTLAETIDE